MDEGMRRPGRGIQWLAWALIGASALAGWNALWVILHLAIAVAKGAPVAGAMLGTSLQWTAAVLVAVATHGMLWFETARAATPRAAERIVRTTARTHQTTWPPTDVMFRPESETTPTGVAHLVIQPKTWAGQPLTVQECPARVFFSEVDTAREFTVRSRFERATIDLPRIDPGRYEVNVWLDVDQDPTTESNHDYFSIRRRNEGPEPHEIVLRDDAQTVVRELPFERNVVLER